MLSLTTVLVTQALVGLATPAQAAVFTLVLVAAPIPAQAVGPTLVLVAVPIQDRAVVPTLAQVVAHIPDPAAVHTLAQAVEPTPVLVVGLMLVPDGLVTVAPEAAILTNGTAHLLTASEKSITNTTIINR